MKNLNEIEHKPSNPSVLTSSSQYPYGWYPQNSYVEEGFNLLDYWRIVKKHLWKIILITFLFSALAAYFSFTSPKIYKIEASILPVSSSGGGGLAGLASQFSYLPIVGGQIAALAGGGSQKSGQLVGILKSRTLNQRVADELNLMMVFFKDRWDPEKKEWRPDWRGRVPTPDDAVSMLQSRIKVMEDKKSGLVKLEFEMTDPKLASDIVNRLFVDLQDFITSNQLTMAKKNRIFIEKQLQKNKAELLEAGKKLNQFYNNNRISSVQPQLDVSIGKVDGPPKTLEELGVSVSELERQKEDLKSKMSESEQVSIVRNIPSQVYLQYLTLQRELLGRINMLLTQQYEMAKIEEAKEDLSFQVIDNAVPPARAWKPKKKLNVAVAFTAGFFLSLFLAFFLEHIRKLKEAERVKKGA